MVVDVPVPTADPGPDGVFDTGDEPPAPDDDHNTSQDIASAAEDPTTEAGTSNSAFTLLARPRWLVM